QQYKLNPATNSRGRRQPGHAPLRVNAEQQRQRLRAQISQHRSKSNADYGEAQWRPRISERIERRRVKPPLRGCEQPYTGTRQNRPDIKSVGVLKPAGFHNRTHYQIPQRNKRDSGRNNEERDPPKTIPET